MDDTTDDLDPDCARVVREFQAEGLPAWHTLSVASARRLEDELFSAGDGPALTAVRDIGIEGPAGDELPLRAYRPERRPPDGDKPHVEIRNRAGREPRRPRRRWLRR